MPSKPILDDEEMELREIEAAYDAAWNRSDAKALAAPLAEDAVVVNPRGQVAVGRADFEAIMAKMLAGPFAGSTHHSTVRRVRFISADVAIVDGEARVTDIKGADTSVEHAFTDIFVRRGGRWLISDVRAYVFRPVDLSNE